MFFNIKHYKFIIFILKITFLLVNIWGKNQGIQKVIIFIFIFATLVLKYFYITTLEFTFCLEHICVHNLLIFRAYHHEYCLVGF